MFGGISHHLVSFKLITGTQLPLQNPNNPNSYKELKKKKMKEHKKTQNSNSKKQYWLLKTEAGEWSWEDQSANGGKTKWDGVKNKQAQKHLKSMRLGDLCFFYHSGPKARRVVGVVRVEKECYDDEEGDTSGGVAVDVMAVGEMRQPVDLAEMKGDDRLKGSGFALFRQPRLSVVPVPVEVWERICELGGGYEGDGGDGGEEEEEGVEKESCTPGVCVFAPM